MKKKWNQERIDFLKNVYNKKNKNELIEIFNVSWGALRQQAAKFGISRNSDFSWKEEEIKILKKSYYDGNLNIICPQRSIAAVSKKARILKLKRKSQRKSNLNVLLEENVISYYWMGFLLADGHFGNRYLGIGIHHKDISHLIKFSKFIQYKGNIKTRNNSNIVYLHLRHKSALNQIKNIFKISSRKTYEPCSIDWIKDDHLLFSLSVGMIDGDGCICNEHNKCRIIIGLHQNWSENLEFIQNFLYKIFNVSLESSISMRNNGAIMVISKRELITKIKKKAEELYLPFLKRKWKRIKWNNNRPYSRNYKRLI